MSVQLKVSNYPAQELALTNCAFVAPADAPGLGPFVEIGASVLSVRPDARIEPGCLGMYGATPPQTKHKQPAPAGHAPSGGVY